MVIPLGKNVISLLVIDLIFPMKHIIEFGNKGGVFTDNIIVPNGKLAAQIANSLVAVFENDWRPADGFFTLKKNETRKSWESPSKYVSVSKLPNNLGPATAKLWYREK